MSSGTDDFDTHRRLGLSLIRLGDFAGAVRELREAIRLKPDSASAHSNLGMALSDSARPRRRRSRSCAKRSAFSLILPRYRINLGLALYRVGILAGAITEMREAIRLKPDLASGHDALGFVLHQVG